VRGDIAKRFGQRVRKLREQRGFSQETLAEKADLDRTYISGVERGQRNLSLFSIQAIADGLGVTVGELMKGL
jgi:transcriptional regulator with XRE-family HTH domain